MPDLAYNEGSGLDNPVCRCGDKPRSRSLSLLDRRHLRRASGRPVDRVRVSDGDFPASRETFCSGSRSRSGLLQFPRLWVGSGAAPGGSIHRCPVALAVSRNQSGVGDERALLRFRVLHFVVEDAREQHRIEGGPLIRAESPVSVRQPGGPGT